MTFKDIALKNFKVNLKKYLSYFFCSSFSVAIFFIYSTLLFNPQLTQGEENQNFSIIFSISLVSIAVFSVFFINYAHTAFVKSRNKEFGIYMSLGMTQKDIGKIILLENSLIISGSLITGLICGITFSRLFQMIVLKLLDFKDISYSISYKCFVLTFIVFAVVFTGVITLSKLSIMKLQVNELLKQSRKHEGSLKYNLLPGIIGVSLILISLVMLYFISKDPDLKINLIVLLVYLITLFVGVYMTISYCGRTILGLIRKNKTAYYSNVITLTEINHKFNQNKKIMFVLSILSAAIIFFVASPFSLYNLTTTIAENSQRNHLEYTELNGVNSISSKTLDEILKKGKTQVTEQITVEFIELYLKNDTGKQNLWNSIPVVSQKVYNSTNNTNFSIPRAGHKHYF